MAASHTEKFESAEVQELKKKLIIACRILDREGITDGYGHVSVRVPGVDAFITIANVSPGAVRPHRLTMQNLDGEWLAGAKTPPNEWPIHACIYKARPDVEAISHTHSKWSTIFSVDRKSTRLNSSHT